MSPLRRCFNCDEGDAAFQKVFEIGLISVKAAAQLRGEMALEDGD